MIKNKLDCYGTYLQLSNVYYCTELYYVEDHDDASVSDSWWLVFWQFCGKRFSIFSSFIHSLCSLFHFIVTLPLVHEPYLYTLCIWANIGVWPKGKIFVFASDFCGQLSEQTPSAGHMRCGCTRTKAGFTVV